MRDGMIHPCLPPQTATPERVATTDYRGRRLLRALLPMPSSGTKNQHAKDSARAHQRDNLAIAHRALAHRNSSDSADFARLRRRNAERTAGRIYQSDPAI